LQVSLNRNEPWAANGGKFNPDVFEWACKTKFLTSQDMEWRHWHPLCSWSSSLGSWCILGSHQVPVFLFLPSWHFREIVSDLLHVNHLFYPVIFSEVKTSCRHGIGLAGKQCN
jgi:hypothetical protein